MCWYGYVMNRDETDVYKKVMSIIMIDGKKRCTECVEEDIREKC